MFVLAALFLFAPLSPIGESAEVIVLREQADELRAKMEQLQKKLSESEDAKSEMDTRIKELLAQDAERNARITELTETMAEIEKKAQQPGEDLQKLQQALDDLQTEKIRLEKAQADATAQLAKHDQALREKTSSYKQTIAKLKSEDEAEDAAFHQKIEQLEAQQQEARNKLSKSAASPSPRTKRNARDSTKSCRTRRINPKEKCRNNKFAIISRRNG